MAVREVASLLRAPAARWLPRRTVRLRLAALYGGLFLVAGALLLTVTYLLVASHVDPAGVRVTAPATGSGYMVVTTGALPTPGPVALGGSFSAAQIPDPTSGPRQLQQVQQYINGALVTQRAHDLNQLLLWSGAALGVMALASVFLGWLIAGRVLAPLRTMTATTRQISAENLDARLALTGPDDELKELGDTIDGLLARLEHAFDAQRRFVANASHELRTPLTLERAMIEVALADPDASVDSLRSVCERVLAAGEEQERLIEALLTLARSQRGLDRHEPVDLEALVAQAIEERGGAIDAGLELTSDLAPAVLAGDRHLVRRLIANLLDNAVRHNGSPGWVRVTTATRGGGAVLTVANSGPRIPRGAEASLLEPFRRAVGERSSHGAGHGLGLSIVAAIAAAHDADLRVTGRAAGGLEVEVCFPPAVVLAPRRASATGAGEPRSLPAPAPPAVPAAGGS
jgi:signal transduction histidine kinase